MAIVGVVGAVTANQAKHAGVDATNQATANAKTQADATTAAATQQAATAKADAETAANQADQANNRANGKSADVGGLSSRNALDAKGGIGSTMLTGPQGIDPKALQLGKTTLLGG